MPRREPAVAAPEQQHTPAVRICPVMEVPAGKKEVQAPAATRSMVGSLDHRATAVHWLFSSVLILSTDVCVEA